MSAHGRSEALMRRSAQRVGSYTGAHGRSEALMRRSAQRVGSNCRE